MPEMGYPMTFQRVVKRNGLTDGDYGDPPQRHRAGMALDGTTATTLSEEESLLGRAPHWAKRVDEYEKAFTLLAGDLRRLENDALDERGICAHIASRTGVDEDTVAAVLKEFIAW